MENVIEKAIADVLYKEYDKDYQEIISRYNEIVKKYIEMLKYLNESSIILFDKAQSVKSHLKDIQQDKSINTLQ